jgi:hypothetical protein
MGVRISGVWVVNPQKARSGSQHEREGDVDDPPSY